jgi:hypothetical protein
MSTEKMDATGRTLDGRKHTASLEHAVKFAGWPTPGSNEGGATMRPSRVATGRTTGYLAETVLLAGWPTPTEGDGSSAGSRSLPTSKAHPGLSLTDASRMAGWPTPKANDAKSTAQSLDRLAEMRGPDSLLDAAKLCGWATPTAGTPNNLRGRGQDPAKRKAQGHTVGLHDQVTMVAHFIPGASLNGLHAPTERGGLLNPEHSRWLQGVPATWPSCAPTATRSTRGSPRK